MAFDATDDYHPYNHKIRRKERKSSISKCLWIAAIGWSVSFAIGYLSFSGDRDQRVHRLSKRYSVQVSADDDHDSVYKPPKIYMYKVPYKLLSPIKGLDSCKKDMYYMEKQFPSILSKHNRIHFPNHDAIDLRNSSQTSDIDYYYIPHFSTCYYHHCVFTLFNSTAAAETCKNRTGDYMDKIMTWVMNESSSSSSNDSSRGGGGGGAGAGGSKWNESGGGTNHLLLFAWDQASEILGWNHPTRLLVKSAIHLTTLGTVGVSPNFDPHKDIVIPPYANYSQVVLELYPGVDEVSRGVGGGGGGGGLGSSAKWKDYRSENVSPTTLFPSWVHGRSDNFNSFDSDSLQSQQKKDEGFEVQEMTGSGNPYSHFSSINNRSMFAYFRGTFISNHNYSHGVRQFLQELGKTHADRYHIKEWHSSKYWEEMGDAVFSLCPSGWSPWSPRLFDSMMTSSIPVLFADGTQLPYEDLIDYRSFTIKISNKNVGKLDKILVKESGIYDTSPKEQQRRARILSEKREQMFKYRWRVIWRDVLTNGASGSTDGVEEGKEEGDKSTVGGGADDKYVQEDAFDSLLRILARKAIINKRIGNVEFV